MKLMQKNKVILMLLIFYQMVLNGEDTELFNGSGGTFIYMAFAENPFVTSTSIPTTAR
jgi:hypothetical protein